eukprot:EG_transcript_15555
MAGTNDLGFNRSADMASHVFPYEFGDLVRYERSNGVIVDAMVIGPSNRGEKYVAIRYERGGKFVYHEAAELKDISKCPRPISPPVENPASKRPKPTGVKLPGKPSPNSLEKFWTRKTVGAEAPRNHLGSAIGNELALTGAASSSSNAAAPPVDMDCLRSGAKRRTRAERLADPRRTFRSAAEKVIIMDAALTMGVRPAAAKFRVAEPSMVSKWLANEKRIRALAKKHGERRCTFHGGKKSAYHDVEGDLRKWVLEKRQKRVLVTKRMVIAKACQWSADLAALQDKRPDLLNEWWIGFRKRRRMTTRRVTSFRKVEDDLVLPLVQRYRANLHRAIRNKQVLVLGNADETALSLEPVAKTTIEDKGQRRVAVRVRGKHREHVTAFC